MKTWEPHLILIRDALAQIEDYRPADETIFLGHAMAQDAILMRLQEIGENLARMRHHDEVAFVDLGDDSWLQLIGLRNVISHGYHHIRPDQIWQIITEELPLFAATLADLPDR
jgi:uncharacterized protein with HEPN domain